MEITIAENSGFCFGVKRAVNLVTVAGVKDIVALGPLVHNPQEMERLKKSGIKKAESLNNIKKGTVAIRAHGVPPEVMNRIKGKGLNFIDGTCPYVRKIHAIASKFSSRGYDVIVLGDREHPEVKGIVGYAKTAFVVKNLQEIEKLSLKNKKVCLVSQTTQSRERFEEIACYLKTRNKDAAIFNTICSDTKSKQEAAVKLAGKSDLMIVIGGKNSANTGRLAELCSKVCTTIHVETKKELNKGMFKNINKVGITAGASTPGWIVDEIIEKIKSFER